MLTFYIILLVSTKIIFIVSLCLACRLKKMLMLSYLYGVISLSYFFCVLPLTAYKENTSLLDFIFVLCVALFYSIFYSLYSISTFVKNKIFINNKKINKICKVLIFSFLITIIELLISSVISIFTSGSILPDFAFTSIGFALSYSPIVFFAKYAHVYGLTFIMCVIVASILELNLNNKIKILLLSIFVLFCFININKKLDNYTQKSPNDIFITKEGESATKNKKIEDLKKEYALIVDSVQEVKYFEDGIPVFYSLSKVYNTEDMSVHKIYKRFRMPFGEYWPWTFKFIKYINPEIYNIMLQTRNYASKDDNKIFTFNGNRYAVLLCSDAWSPISVNNIMRQNPDIIILQRSDDVFHSNPYFLAHIETWKRVLLAYTNVRIIDVNE